MLPTILHLIDTGGPGGAETVFLSAATGLSERGWSAVPVIARDDWLAARLRDSRIHPNILDPKGSFNLAYLRRLRHLVKEHKPKIILAHLYGSAIYGSVLGRLTGVPVVSILHGQSDISTAERFSSTKARIVASGSARLVAVSTSLRDDLAKRIPANPDRWSIIPNGVDTKILQPGSSIDLRRRLAISRETCLVGALGNIRKPKAYDVLLQVAARLGAENPNYHFVIAGQGSGRLLEELLTLRAQLGLEHKVHFLGMETDIAGYLGDLDVFLSTSSTEGFSIACVEAMACRLPVVATRSGGPQDIVLEGRTGFLAKVGDVDGLATAVATLADDTTLRSKMANAARARAKEKFSLNSMLDAYERLLKRFTSH